MSDIFRHLCDMCVPRSAPAALRRNGNRVVLSEIIQGRLAARSRSIGQPTTHLCKHAAKRQQEYSWARLRYLIILGVDNVNSEWSEVLQMFAATNYVSCEKEHLLVAGTRAPLHSRCTPNVAVDEYATTAPSLARAIQGRCALEDLRSSNHCPGC